MHRILFFLFASFLALSPVIGSPWSSPLSLEDAEHYTLHHHPHILAAEEKTIAGRERQLQTISHWLPSVYAAANSERVKNQADRSFFAGVEVSQQLFNGPLFYATRLGALDAASTRMSLSQVKNDLLLAVRVAYYHVALTQETLEEQESFLSFASQALDLEKKKQENGSADALDVKQTEVLLASSLHAYFIARKALRNAHNTLAEALGLDPDEADKLQITQKQIKIKEIPELAALLGDASQSSSFMLAPIDEQAKTLLIKQEDEEALTLAMANINLQQNIWEESALLTNPSLGQQRIHIKASSTEKDRRLSQYLPTISAFGQYGYTSHGAFGSGPCGMGGGALLGVLKNRNFWEGGFRMYWSLFDGLGRERKVREQSAIKKAATFTYAQMTHDLKRKIRNEVNDLIESILSYKASLEGSLAATASIPLAQKAREAGHLSSLELRRVLIAHNLAITQRNQEAFNVVRAYFQLRHAAGTDVSGH